MKSTRGFTLIEILMGMAVLGVIATVAFQYSINTVAASKSQNLDSDFNVLSSNLAMIVANDCTKLLRGNQFVVGQTFPADITTPSGATYTVIPTLYPARFNGVKATGVQVASVFGPLTTSVDGTREFSGTLSLTAQRTSSNGTILPGSQTYSKTYDVLTWVDAGQNVVSCQRTSPPTGSSFNIAGDTPPIVCPGNVVPAVWAITSGNAKDVYLVEGSTKVPGTITSPTGGGFNITIPAGPGPLDLTYTLFVVDTSGVPSWANTAAQTQIVHVGDATQCP